MDTQFFDSSAIVKNYLNETGTAWIKSLITAIPSNEIYVSRLASVEVVSVIVRRVRSGLITTTDGQNYLNRFKSDLSLHFKVVEISLPLVSTAVNLVEKHGLRGYDAIQLASGLTLSLRLSAAMSTPFSFTFISADNNLNNAAQSESLAVDNPNNHP